MWWSYVNLFPSHAVDRLQLAENWIWEPVVDHIIMYKSMEQNSNVYCRTWYVFKKCFIFDSVTLVQALGTSGWMTWSVQEKSSSFRTVTTDALRRATVVTLRMLDFAACVRAEGVDVFFLKTAATVCWIYWKCYHPWVWYSISHSFIILQTSLAITGNSSCRPNHKFSGTGV